MLRILLLMVFTTLVGLPGVAVAQTPDEMKRRIEQLERENASLRKENVALRGRVIALEGNSAKPQIAKDGAKPVKAVAQVDGPKWSHWLEFGGNLSSERSRTEAGLFSPLWQSPSSLVFADLRGKLFEENVTEGNFALGVRHMLTSGWNLGAWAGYDVRRSTTGNVFHQAAFGLEALHPEWDFRVNGYVPISDAKAGGSLTEVKLSGNQIFLSGAQELPLWGFDAEAGVRLFADPPGSGLRNEFKLYAGGFWFDHRDAPQSVAGPRARAEWSIDNVLAGAPGSRLTLEAGVRYDEVRKADWEVGAKLRIPFGGGVDQAIRTASLTEQERRMMDRIERDVDIVTAASREPVSDSLTGVRFDRVAYTAGHGNSVTNASNAAGTNSLIIANGTVSGSQQLQGNQTLQGGASTIQVRGQKSGVVANFTAPGAAAALINAGNATNLSPLGSNVHMAGVEIVGTGNPANTSNHGIAWGNNLQNIFIDQVAVRETGGNGIEFSLNNTVTIMNSSVSHSQGTSIQFVSDNVVTITGTTITNSALGSGIYFENANQVTLMNSRLAGIFNGSGIVLNSFLAGNTVSGDGNTASGATFGDVLCGALNSSNIGSFGFDNDGTGNPGTCP